MIGIDIQDVERVEKFALTNKMQRMFSQRELEYINQKGNAGETIAGMFCAKEAFFKAVGSGINLSQLTQVEIAHHKTGAPYYILSPDVIQQHNLTAANINLSISHTKNTAVAVCVILNVVKDLSISSD